MSDSDIREKIEETTRAVLLGTHAPGNAHKEYLRSSQNSPLTDPTAFRKYMAAEIADALMSLFTEKMVKRQAGIVAQVHARLDDYYTEVHIDGESRWTQVVYWDDIEEVFEAVNNQLKGGESAIFKPKNMQLAYCEHCNQMTNHTNGLCLKHGKEKK